MQNYIKIVRAFFEIRTKNIKNAPKRLVTFVPLSCTNFIEIFKDGRTIGRTDMGDYIGPPRVNLGSKIRKKKLMDSLLRYLKTDLKLPDGHG